MHSSSPLLLAFAGLSLAQTSTLTMYIPGADVQPLEASVITSDATATTYLLKCIDGTDSNDCGLAGAMTLTEGPATAAYTFAPELDANGSVAFTGYMDCSLAGTISAVCIESFNGDEANFPGLSTETYTGTDMPFMPVLVTGLAAGGSATTPSSAPATTTSSGALTTSASTSGGSTTTSSGSGSSAVQTSTTSTSVSTGGMPAMTGDRIWVFGGAAVALAILA